MKWIGSIQKRVFFWRLRYPRFRLKKWLELDSIKSDYLEKAVEERDAGWIADVVCQYLSLALGKDKNFWLELPWKMSVEAFQRVELANQPTKEIPLIVAKIKKDSPVFWHYTGRNWVLWADIFSSEYGWSLEYVAELEIDMAVGMMQEILVRRQLDKEFQWMLSDVAYPYNQATKKNEFHPMVRPEFMKPTSDSIKIPKIRIRKDFMPVGNIIDLTEDRLN